MALVIHSQAHLEPHLQTDGDILVEMLRTQVLVVPAVVPVVLVLMVIVVMEHTVEQVFNFLQHIETQQAPWDSLDQVVVDIG
jgi:predicted sugar kinase